MYSLLSNGLALHQLPALLRKEVFLEYFFLLRHLKGLHYALEDMVGWIEVGATVEGKVVTVFRARCKLLKGDGGSIDKLNSLSYKYFVFSLNFGYDLLQRFHSVLHLFDFVLRFEQVDFTLFFQDGEIIDLLLKHRITILEIIYLTP